MTDSCRPSFAQLKTWWYALSWSSNLRTKDDGVSREISSGARLPEEEQWIKLIRWLRDDHHLILDILDTSTNPLSDQWPHGTLINAIANSGYLAGIFLGRKSRGWGLQMETQCRGSQTSLLWGPYGW